MPAELSAYLKRLETGDPKALDELVQILYGELRTMARARLRDERPDHTLSATALVNEAYMRLSGNRKIAAASRTRFMAVAATTMRRVLIDYARTRKRAKRGGGQAPVPLHEVEPFLSDDEAEQVLALDSSLDRLGERSPRAAEVVVQRFYGGMSLTEIAERLGVTERTVRRDWVMARAWLRKEVAASA